MSVRIGLGLARFPGATPRDFWRFVATCEDSPIDSLWQTDRLVAETPFLESVTAMAAIAGATRRIKFGMNAVVVSFRDPLLLAKQCASIDFVSGGRLLPVFGVGSERAPEWRASSSGRPERRGARANEALALMQQLWTEEHVDFTGRFYQYRDVSIAPRPVQRPLPCWIGGASEAAVRRTARLGTGWLGGTQTPNQVRAVIAAIRHALARTERSIDPDHYGATLTFRFGEWDGPLRSLARARVRSSAANVHPEELFCVGQRETLLTRLRDYHAAGASKFVLIPLARDTADLIEQTRRVVTELVPEVHAWPAPPVPEPAPLDTSPS